MKGIKLILAFLSGGVIPIRIPSLLVSELSFYIRSDPTRMHGCNTSLYFCCNAFIVTLQCHSYQSLKLGKGKRVSGELLTDGVSPSLITFCSIENANVDTELTFTLF